MLCTVRAVGSGVFDLGLSLRPADYLRPKLSRWFHTFAAVLSWSGCAHAHFGRHRLFESYSAAL